MMHNDVRGRIVHLLRIYHILSPTMLQAGLGPQIPSKLWRPILENMIADGDVAISHIVAEAPSGRHNTYTRLTLNGKHKDTLL